jgi:hypothetical protein
MNNSITGVLLQFVPLALVLMVWIAIAYYYARKVRSVKPPTPEELIGPTDCLTLARRVDGTNFMRRFLVFIDDRQVGYIKTGEVVHFPLLPGKHSISVKVDWCKSKPVIVEKSADSNVVVWCGSRYNDWRCVFMGFINPSEYVFVGNKQA